MRCQHIGVVVHQHIPPAEVNGVTVVVVELYGFVSTGLHFVDHNITTIRPHGGRRRQNRQQRHHCQQPHKGTFFHTRILLMNQLRSFNYIENEAP